MFAVPPLDYLANSDKVRVVGVTHPRRRPPWVRKRVLTLSPVAGVPKSRSAIVKANRWNGEPPRPLPN